VYQDIFLKQDAYAVPDVSGGNKYRAYDRSHTVCLNITMNMMVTSGHQGLGPWEDTVDMNSFNDWGELRPFKRYWLMLWGESGSSTASD